MVEEIKKELEHLFKTGGMDKVVNILEKYHPAGKKATSDAQILVVSEYMRSAKSRRNEFIPLCTFSTSRDVHDKKYAGVGFGTIPKGIMIKAVNRKIKR